MKIDVSEGNSNKTTTTTRPDNNKNNSASFAVSRSDPDSTVLQGAAGRASGSPVSEGMRGVERVGATVLNCTSGADGGGGGGEGAPTQNGKVPLKLTLSVIGRSGSAGELVEADGIQVRDEASERATHTRGEKERE